ncbi:MAG: PKD domain-containing protein [Cellulomonas sp.]
MRLRRACLAAVAATALISVAPTAQADSSGTDPSIGAYARSASVEVSASAGAADTPTRKATGPDRDVSWRRAAMVVCTDNQSTDVPLHDPDFICQDGPTFPAPHTCPPGQRSLDALYRQVRDPTRPSGWSEWQHVADATCVDSPDLAGALATELKNLPLAPSPASIPPNGWVMVNMDTVVYTTLDPQTLQTTVLGQPVTINARPVRFTWDFADGSAPLVTTDPGRPFPHQTVAYQYRRGGTYPITLTTTWVADYQVTGTDTWEPVPGDATTTTTAGPLAVYTARSHLVDGPLR